MIETARLVLRAPVAADLPWILENMNTLAVMRHLGGVRSAASVAERLDADIAAFAETGHGRWILWLRGEARPIGRCGLFRIGSEAAPGALRGQEEIGWTLAEGFWRQGYASEAARAVLGFAFGTLGHDAIHAQTSDSNRNSSRLMTRLGFVRHSALDYVDPVYPPVDNPTTVYRLTREAWEAQR